MLETIVEQPMITEVGVIQTFRHYDYDKGQVIIERQVNGKQVSEETFYMD